jgi:hypothetical protein
MEEQIGKGDSTCFTSPNTPQDAHQFDALAPIGSAFQHH